MRNGTQRSPVSVLILILLTCGLYYFWWAYTTSREIDEYLGESDIPPIVHLLLLIFTGTLWWFVWDILTARRIARMQARAGLPAKDNSILYLILNLLGAGPVAGLGVLVALLQQSDLNAIYAAGQR